MKEEDCKPKSQQINPLQLIADSSISTVRRLYTAIGYHLKLKQNTPTDSKEGPALPYYLLLLLVLIIAYLPLSTFYWGMKNDAFSANFPNKFFFTQALHSGFLPLWNPYCNFGLPLYADPGFAFWNPITWIFGSVIGYNAYSLTFEVLLYLYLAGFFMFRLCKFLFFANAVSFLVACMFMCCGFFSSHIQHINFITCAPFIPLLLHRFLQLQQQPSYRNAFFSSIAYYFVFASGHPAMPVAAIYFLLILFLFLITSPDYRKKLPGVIAFHLLAIAFLIIEFLPAIYSYINILPVYARGVPINLKDHLYKDSFDLKSLITFLFPFSSTAKTGFFVNDPTMRNCYFSLIGIVCFCIGVTKRSPLIKSLFFTGILMFFLSWGDGIKLFLFSRLPGLSYIKTNGEFRVFGIFCFCVIAAYGLQDLFDQKNRVAFLARNILKVFLTVSVLLILGSLLYNRNNLPAITIFNIPPGSTTVFIKTFIDHLSFKFCLFLSNVICTIICISLLLQRKWTSLKIIYITLADIIINTILILPVTTIGSTPLSQIKKIDDSCRKGIVIPVLVPLNQLKEFDPVTTGLLGSYSYYDSNIGTRQLTGYPSYFRFTEDYFNSPLKNSLQSQPFIFLQSNIRNLPSRSFISITKFSPQEIGFSVNSPMADTIVLLQNHYKYWHCTVNAKQVVVTTAYASFMAIPIGEGINKIIFTYYDPLLLFCCLVSMIFVLSFLIRYSCFKRR
jgi:hypothetical protein